MYKRLLILSLFASMTLTGCVPALVVAGATAGGAILYDNRSFSQMNADANSTHAARTHIASDPTLQNDAHINVSVYNGIMLLTGEAPTPELRQEALSLVSDISGIKHIYNEITVQPPTSHSQRMKDSWITTKVKSAMLTKNGLRSTNIRVTTENGVVFLMGNVSHEQANQATDVARRVAGVRKVVKVFEYPQ